MISLRNTTWFVPGDPDISTFEETVTAPINFKSNDQFFSSMTFAVETEGEDEEAVTTYTLLFDDTVIYVYGDSYPDAYRTIHFIDGELIDEEAFYNFISSIMIRIDVLQNFRVQRQPMDGNNVAYEFETPGMQFLVKNFTDDSILVNFEEITDANADYSALIPPGTAQVIVTNTGYPKKEFDTVYAIGDGTGDVEIQMILW